jgi:hypothetical protein
MVRVVSDRPDGRPAGVASRWRPVGVLVALGFGCLRRRALPASACSVRRAAACRAARPATRAATDGRLRTGSPMKAPVGRVHLTLISDGATETAAPSVRPPPCIATRLRRVHCPAGEASRRPPPAPCLPRARALPRRRDPPTPKPCPPDALGRLHASNAPKRFYVLTYPIAQRPAQSPHGEDVPPRGQPTHACTAAAHRPGVCARQRPHAPLRL